MFVLMRRSSRGPVYTSIFCSFMVFPSSILLWGIKQITPLGRASALRQAASRLALPVSRFVSGAPLSPWWEWNPAPCLIPSCWNATSLLTSVKLCVGVFLYQEFSYFNLVLVAGNNRNRRLCISCIRWRLMERWVMIRTSETGRLLQSCAPNLFSFWLSVTRTAARSEECVLRRFKGNISYL